jgi:hypothetical protein
MTLDVRLDVADPFVNSGNEPPELEVPLAPARRTRYRTARVGLRALLPLTVLGLWWLLSGLGWVPTNLLPGPVAIAQTFWSMLASP